MSGRVAERSKAPDRGSGMRPHASRVRIPSLPPDPDPLRIFIPTPGRNSTQQIGNDTDQEYDAYRFHYRTKRPGPSRPSLGHTVVTDPHGPIPVVLSTAMDASGTRSLRIHAPGPAAPSRVDLDHGLSHVRHRESVMAPIAFLGGWPSGSQDRLPRRVALGTGWCRAVAETHANVRDPACSPGHGS